VSIARPELDVAHDGSILRLTLNRPSKGNALNDALAGQLEDVLGQQDESVRAILIVANGPHFCAGLDLSEQKDRGPLEVHKLSRRWHAIKERLQFGPPVVASLQDRKSVV
jgi:enoyl-CoA hydratase/carnithine racemase